MKLPPGFRIAFEGTHAVLYREEREVFSRYCAGDTNVIQALTVALAWMMYREMPAAYVVDPRAAELIRKR